MRHAGALVERIMGSMLSAVERAICPSIFFFFSIYGRQYAAAADTDARFRFSAATLDDARDMLLRRRLALLGVQQRARPCSRLPRPPIFDVRHRRPPIDAA